MHIFIMYRLVYKNNVCEIHVEYFYENNRFVWNLTY